MKVHVCGLHKKTVLVRGVCLECKGTGPFELAIEAGDIFRHTENGHSYRVIDVGVWTGATMIASEHPGQPIKKGDPVVIYIGCYDNPKGNEICVRRVSEWIEDVEVAQKIGDAKVPQDKFIAKTRKQRYVLLERR